MIICMCLHKFPCLEEIGARASIRTCTLVCKSDCFLSFEIACAFQDLCIGNTEFLVAEACQMSCLGHMSQQDKAEL